MGRRENKIRRNQMGGNLFQSLVWLLLGLFLLSGAWAVSAQERLAGQVIRLHVLASSDRPEDQARKLRVRDAVLSRTEVFLRDAGDRAEAEAILRERLLDLRNAAASVLAREGCRDGVRVELAETDFPTRVYETADVSVGGGGEQDGFALPAGRYLALRVVIGPGAGRNWWCVVFPPLCGGTEKRNAPEKTELPEKREAPEIRKLQEKRERKEDAKLERDTAEPEQALEPAAGTEQIPKPAAGTEQIPKPAAGTEQILEAAAGTEQIPEAEKRDIPKDAGTPGIDAAAPVRELPAAPAAAPVRGLPAAARRYEVRFRIVELWGRVRAALP